MMTMAKGRDGTGATSATAREKPRVGYKGKKLTADEEEDDGDGKRSKKTKEKISKYRKFSVAGKGTVRAKRKDAAGENAREARSLESPRAGGAAEIAEDPEDAFDWVLLDRRMPGLDGVATAALLRERPATRTAQLALLVNEPADDPRIPDLFDQVLVRPEQPEALKELLEATLRKPSNAIKLPSQEGLTPGRMQLERLRDETLAEDLRSVAVAYARGDRENVEAHLHRMKGALRFCPDTDLASRFQDLEARAADQDEVRFRACVDALASGLRVAVD